MKEKMMEKKNDFFQEFNEEQLENVAGGNGPTFCTLCSGIEAERQRNLSHASNEQKWAQNYYGIDLDKRQMHVNRQETYKDMAKDLHQKILDRQEKYECCSSSKLV